MSGWSHALVGNFPPSNIQISGQGLAETMQNRICNKKLRRGARDRQPDSKGPKTGQKVTQRIFDRFWKETSQIQSQFLHKNADLEWGSQKVEITCQNSEEISVLYLGPVQFPLDSYSIKSINPPSRFQIRMKIPDLNGQQGPFA
jgi:hypothetical protein